MSDWDRQTTPGGIEGPQWVSAAEAADVAGVTPGTVRYWARNGLIVSEVAEGPAGEKVLVRLDEVLQHARQEAPSRQETTGPRPPAAPAPGAEGVVTDLPARTSELAPILQSIPDIMAQLTAATDRAARAETKVEFLTAQLTDLRRRLAESEAGGDGESPAVLPEAWAQPDDPVATLAEEVPDESPAVAGWPAPPPETLRDEAPAESAEPGPESIDWTPRDTQGGADGAESSPAADAPAVRADAAAEDLSLGDIWNEPAAPTVMTPVDQPAEPASDDVNWHEPAHSSGGPAARPANAPVPDADELYGPRRRRWFKRRR